jgi:hypothetical protein
LDDKTLKLIFTFHQQFINLVTWKHFSQQASVQISSGSACDGTAMASAMQSTAKVFNPAILRTYSQHSVFFLTYELEQ